MVTDFRDDEVCKQVPVVRQVPKCQEQEKVLCEAQPYQLQFQRCQLINSPVCSTEVRVFNPVLTLNPLFTAPNFPKDSHVYLNLNLIRPVFFLN